MSRQLGAARPAGRPWRCLLCPVRGREADEQATTAAFYRHYMAMHMTRVD